MAKAESGNFISEWFGQRIYPRVVVSAAGLADMRASRCPFLSEVSGEATECIKAENSKGVCTVSSCSNGLRQDWVACPYRVFDPELIELVTSRLYGQGRIPSFAGPVLAEAKAQAEILALLKSGKRALVYFNTKVGGEVSVSGTQRSPEMKFDVTFVELLWRKESVAMGRFAILEVQTTDFHGSYKHAVKKLQGGLELHPKGFPSELRRNQWWAGDEVEGPNISNVFKRTFYQMMFKFSFGAHDDCAGTALMISSSVWDSWQSHLAAPKLRKRPDGTWRLEAPGVTKRRGEAGSVSRSGRVPAWIYVFDMEADSPTSPNPVKLKKVIGLTADALGHYALKAAPAEMSKQLLSDVGIYATLKRRIEQHWPGQSVNVSQDVVEARDLTE